MNPDYAGYFRFTTRARLDKTVNTLRGILLGIQLDSQIDPEELALLSNWVDANTMWENKHPFNEIVPAIKRCLTASSLSNSDRQDLLWVCEKLQSSEYYDPIAADIQCLYGILAGILSDGIIAKSELIGLSDWLSEHHHLRGCWPYEEINSLLTGVLSDKKIDEAEAQMLKAFFEDLVSASGERASTNPKAFLKSSIRGVCAVCPEITFHNSLFCFTGISRYPRKELVKFVKALDGSVVDSITQKINYLVIGADANPCWTYACYGRKVEEAMALRRQGSQLLIVHENDFLDAIQDAGLYLPH